MGTSSSSDGPGARVPMVPPWADDPPGNAVGEEPNGQNDNVDSPQTPVLPTPIAPNARFGGARKSSHCSFVGRSSILTGSRCNGWYPH